MMLNNYFVPEEHFFLCRTTSDGSDGFTSITNNIINWKDFGKGKIRKLIGAMRIMKQSQNIVVHGFTFSLKWLILMYFCRKELKQKGVWVIWGADLYNYHRTKGSIVINKIINYMEDKIRETCRTSVVVFPTDLAVFKKVFGEKKAVFCAPIGFSDISFSQWDEVLKHREEVMQKFPDAYARADRKVSIQVGHNAFPFNRHGAVLCMLEPYKSQNILITMPMSYGNDYGNENASYPSTLMNLAYNLFPKEKIRQLTAIIPLRKYYDFLGNVDVSILYAPRQNALGNIIPLLYMGKKVFLSEDNPLFDFFKSKGFEIYNVKDIPKMSYEEFIAPIKSSYPNPWIKNYYSVGCNAKRWKVVLEYSDRQYSLEEAYAMMNTFDLEEEEYMKKYIEEQKRQRIEDLEKEQIELRREELMLIYNWLANKEQEDQRAMEEKAHRRKEWQEKVKNYCTTMNLRAEDRITICNDEISDQKVSFTKEHTINGGCNTTADIRKAGRGWLKHKQRHRNNGK